MPPTSSWQTGDVVDGLYEVRDIITSGGMGDVHRVWHREWDVELAVKTPNATHAKTDEQKANFKAEAEAWVGLGLHPHVVSCIYVREIDGLPRVFAEWVDGGSLHDVIKSRKLCSGTPEEVLARILDIAIQFGWGLAHAHASGLIHQDVKPQNLMLTRDWVAKVSDFGLAKARPVGGGDGLPVGDGGTLMAAHAGMLTKAYCSPEQARPTINAEGRVTPLTRATDVWSWAISVWEMFTGYPPAGFGQLAAALFAEYRDDPVAWSEDRQPSAMPMPAPVAALLERCFEEDPQRRPREIGALADELAAVYAELIGVPYPREKPDAAALLADGLNNHALSMLDLGHTEQAEQLWEQALTSDFQQVDAVYNFGLHCWRTGQIADTQLVEALETVRSSHPSAHADYLLAQVHLERYDTAKARELLSVAAHNSPRERGISDALRDAQQQIEPVIRTLATFGKFVDSVATSADNRLAVSCDRGGVRVWDLASGRCVRTLAGHTQQVNGVAVSDDGRIAVSGGYDATVRIWDLDSGTSRTLSGHTDAVMSVALSADGRLAVSGSEDATLRVWDLVSGTCMHTLHHDEFVSDVAMSANGRIAVSASEDTTVRVWDVLSGVCRHILSDHVIDVSSVAVSADGRIAVSGDNNGTVRVWDLDGGKCLRTLTGHTSWVVSLAVSANGRIAASGSDRGTIRVWDLSSGRSLRALSGHTELVTSVALSADGSSVISGSHDTTLRVWDVPTVRGRLAGWSYSHPRGAVELHAAVDAIDFAVQRARTLLGAGDGRGAAAHLREARAVPGYWMDPRLVELWGRLAGLGQRGRLQDAWLRSAAGHAGGNLSVAVSADGRIAVCGSPFDDAASVWNLANGTRLHTLIGHTNSVESLAVSADGRLALSADDPGALRLWDLTRGSCMRTVARSRGARSVAMTGDGHIAVSGNFDQTVLVWDLATGTCMRPLAGHTDGGGHAMPVSVAASANGRIAVSGGKDKAVRVWDLVSGSCLHVLQGHTEPVASVAVSADGGIAVSGSYDRTVRVWDVSSGACLHTLDHQTHMVSSVAVSADGRVALSGSFDRMVRVWDVSSGTCLRTLTGHIGPVTSVALSADARMAVSGSKEGTLRMWALDWEYEFPEGPVFRTG